MARAAEETGALQTGRITESELAVQSREFLHRLRAGLASGGTDKANSAYATTLEFLSEISRRGRYRAFRLRKPRCSSFR